MSTPSFQGIINKSMYDENGNEFIQVKHNGKLFKVYTAQTAADMEALKAVDDQYFKGAQQIPFNVLERIRNCGKNLMYRDESGEVVAVSQILFSSIAEQEVRRSEAFSYGTAGRGFGQIMYKAQEVAAREAHKQRIRLTVRVENTISIRAQLKAGFRITEYDPTRYGLMKDGGARLIMEKDLINETFPFHPHKQAALVARKEVPILNALAEAEELLVPESLPPRVGTFVYNENRTDETSHQIINRIMSFDYIGAGLLLPEEYGGRPGTQKLLVFYRKDSPPRADRLSLPVQVHSEFGRLREVIVSFTPENAQIHAKYAINDVARQNVNNIDPIAFKDEYNLFVGTMVDHGIRVVHTNAIGSEGKSAIFTRDPAYVVGTTLVVGRLGQQQRVYESESMRQIGQGRPTLDLTGEPGAVTEGGDIIIIGEKKLAVGIGQRTTAAGLEKLRQAFPDYEFIAVPHADLHLDVLFTMVGEKKCLADLSQLPEAFVTYLRNDGFTVIEADPAEQPTLGCNVVCVGDNKVIAVKENAATNQRLREHGVEVIEVSMPNIIKWGGGPRCMTCPTHRELV
ncbi:MAG: hypothetical protein H6628_19150 [Calditrichae bacterium]|nr:hypothetical protein [Calditrichia bacterium]